MVIRRRAVIFQLGTSATARHRIAAIFRNVSVHFAFGLLEVFGFPNAFLGFRRADFGFGRLGFLHPVSPAGRFGGMTVLDARRCPGRGWRVGPVAGIFGVALCRSRHSSDHDRLDEVIKAGNEAIAEVPLLQDVHVVDAVHADIAPKPISRRIESFKVSNMRNGVVQWPHLIVAKMAKFGEMHEAHQRDPFKI